MLRPTIYEHISPIYLGMNSGIGIVLGLLSMMGNCEIEIVDSS